MVYNDNSHVGRTSRYPHIGECTLPLHVLAVACTVRNEALRDIMGALRGITERCRSVMGCGGALITEHYERCVTLQDVTEVLRIVTERYRVLTEHYGTITENIDFAHH